MIGHGFYVNPTMFDAVGPSMRIAREEIFGPVSGVIEAKSAEKALAVAVDTDYGLHATVFTRDIDKAIHFARRLPCGAVSINRYSEGDIKTPFGGFKRSGSLARDKGSEALDQHNQTKTIWLAIKPLLWRVADADADAIRTAACLNDLPDHRSRRGHAPRHHAPGGGDLVPVGR